MGQKRNNMDLRKIAGTDIYVSPIGLGTVKFGRNQQVKYPSAFELPDDNAVEKLLHEAFSYGINLIDTAPAYGTSEKRLGKLLPHSRHDWVISTKVGEQFINGISSFDFSEPAIKKSIENSLQQLKTDYLDIVLIHSNGEDRNILLQTDVLITLKKLKEKGMIRAIGISSKTVEGGFLAFELGCDLAMVAFNPLYENELPVIKKAAELKKSIFVKKSFSSGHLHSFKNKNPIEYIFSHIFKWPAVSSVIIGTISPKHLKENVEMVRKILGS